jgi:hypothetical protein
MFKGLDADACETVCLRNREWGTEIELFIGSEGTHPVPRAPCPAGGPPRRAAPRARSSPAGAGEFRIRADRKQHVINVYPDGHWVLRLPPVAPQGAVRQQRAARPRSRGPAERQIDYLPATEKFDMAFAFQHLREAPGFGWREARGGADAYTVHRQPPRVPNGTVPVDTALLRAPGGWTPAQDRLSDQDLLNTSYRWPAPREESAPPPPPSC